VPVAVAAGEGQHGSGADRQVALCGACGAKRDARTAVDWQPGPGGQPGSWAPVVPSVGCATRRGEDVSGRKEATNSGRWATRSLGHGETARVARLTPVELEITAESRVLDGR
jgi:hypothetical protein